MNNEAWTASSNGGATACALSRYHPACPVRLIGNDPADGIFSRLARHCSSHARHCWRVLASYGNESLQDVPAIGARSVWSERRGQLSVLANKHIYHVAVEDIDSPETVRERAEKLALLLVDQFD